jgi:superfamily II DNA/RNA helicase
LSVTLAAPLQEVILHLQSTRPKWYKEMFGTSPIFVDPYSEYGNRISWLHAQSVSVETHFDNPTVPEHIRKQAAFVRTSVLRLMCNYLLGPYFASLSTEDNELGALCDDEAQLSPQLVALNEILSECANTDMRILVFVETRSLASKVSAYLLKRHPYFNCRRLVGQSEMLWRGQEGQKAVLEAFRAGTVRLIVSTSVLEEGKCLVFVPLLMLIGCYSYFLFSNFVTLLCFVGFVGLDVAECNLVIRFGGAPTLIQVVQSKGRARKSDGELKVIMTAEEERHFERLMEQESMLDQVYASMGKHSDCNAAKGGGEVAVTLPDTRCYADVDFIRSFGCR